MNFISSYLLHYADNAKIFCVWTVREQNMEPKLVPPKLNTVLLQGFPNN